MDTITIIKNKVEQLYDEILNKAMLNEEQVEKLGEYQEEISDILYEMNYISEHGANEPMNGKDTIDQGDFI